MQTTLQIAGVLLAIITIWLDTRENIWARPLSLVGTSMALFVYYPAGLYAKCLLNGCYIVLNVYGWHKWLYGGEEKTTLQVSKTPAKILILATALGLVAAAALGRLFAFYSKASLPYWDSLHTIFSLMAQWMLMHKKLESWILWIGLDVLYPIVCYHQALYLFSGLKLAYIVLAIQGYRSWHQSYQQHLAAPTGSSDGSLG
ncbi:MAG: nicotinamide riboside transporter PnuC [Bacteroidota bacterium]